MVKLNHLHRSRQKNDLMISKTGEDVCLNAAMTHIAGVDVHTWHTHNTWKTCLPGHASSSLPSLQSWLSSHQSLPGMHCPVAQRNVPLCWPHSKAAVIIETRTALIGMTCRHTVVNMLCLTCTSLAKFLQITKFWSSHLQNRWNRNKYIDQWYEVPSFFLPFTYFVMWLHAANTIKTSRLIAKLNECKHCNKNTLCNYVEEQPPRKLPPDTMYTNGKKPRKAYSNAVHQFDEHSG